MINQKNNPIDISQTKESFLIMLGLFTISASTMMVEIALTRFLSFKVYYHYTYAVVNLVILAFALAGAYTYLRTNLQSQPRYWKWVSRNALLYSITLLVSIAIFSWLPLDPYNKELSFNLRFSSVYLYFLILSIPFFFAGICISYTLYASKRPVTEILFYDLFGASLGAILCPPVLYYTGGYGLISIASTLGILSSLLYLKETTSPKHIKSRVTIFLAILVIFLSYPLWALKKYGFEIRSSFDYNAKNSFLKNFGGVSLTNWNIISRVDVSKTGDAKDSVYRYGLASKDFNEDIPGRLILINGTGNTRQMKTSGEISKKNYLKNSLWASPYIVTPSAKNVLILGAGGGFDILVAKYFRAKEIDVVEINPFIYKLLLGRISDPEKELYQSWIVSDKTTQVNIYNSEGRHFSSKAGNSKYDIIQAGAVVYVSAITTGGISLQETYLYTTDALKDYWRILKPNGVLFVALPDKTAPYANLRLFFTFIKFLESLNIEKPYKHIVSIRGYGWLGNLLKKSPFTESEINQIKNWAKEVNYTLLFNPYYFKESKLKLNKYEILYTKIGLTTNKKRQGFLNKYSFDVSPITDENPYLLQNLRFNNLPFIFRENIFLFILYIAASLLPFTLVFIPLLVYRKNLPKKELISYLISFSLCGFGFMIFEISLIQKLSVIVGGPTYSLVVVLVCILVGYSVGSYIAKYLHPGYLTFLLLGVILFAAYFILGSSLPQVIEALFPMPLTLRLIFSGLVGFIVSMLTALPVTLGLHKVKTTRGNLVIWMWGIISAFNVLGGIAFPLLSQLMGLSKNFFIAMICYLLACILFAVASSKGCSKIAHRS